MGIDLKGSAKKGEKKIYEGKHRDAPGEARGEVFLGGRSK